MSLKEQRTDLEEKAKIWDEGHEDGFWNGRMSSGTKKKDAKIGVEHAREMNPFRKLLEELDKATDPVRDELVGILVGQGASDKKAQKYADALLEAGFTKLIA